MTARAADTDAIRARSVALIRIQDERTWRRTDCAFALLMVFQWAGGVALALALSPYAWVGTEPRIHPHVWSAIFLGACISIFPIALAWKHPGEAVTRHVIAAGQMLSGALLIHLSGGRIESHFHIFGSLAFLAFYRDTKVITTATIVVALDHLARGLWWPQSVYGVLTPEFARTAEHGFWVLFEDLFLFVSLRYARKDVLAAATQQARLEALTEEIEERVVARTAELKASEEHAHLQTAALESSQTFLNSLVENLPVYVYRQDRAGYITFANKLLCERLGMPPHEVMGTVITRLLIPAEADHEARVESDIMESGKTYESTGASIQIRGEPIFIHIIKVPVFDVVRQCVGVQGMFFDVTERKRAEAELAQLHTQLLDTSRQAGMSEVATSVLHNVGNVLNSVNVSATLVGEKLRGSKVVNLRRLGLLLHEHTHHLTDFLTNDPKGKMVPNYLRTLSEQVENERQGMIEEVKHLVKNIEHIKEIVAMQQSYAKVSGVMENVLVAELVDDALRINASDPVGPRLEIRREYQPGPRVNVERHKVLQVLVNLIQNARQSCEACGRSDQRVTVRIVHHEAEVRVSVSDNGIGIPVENLTRIFAHGFTTKKNGHGFGLHSGAIAAHEMGGSLCAHSDGPGLGAVFTLELRVR